MPEPEALVPFDKREAMFAQATGRSWHSVEQTRMDRTPRLGIADPYPGSVSGIDPRVALFGAVRTIAAVPFGSGRRWPADA